MDINVQLIFHYGGKFFLRSFKKNIIIIIILNASDIFQLSVNTIFTY